MQKRLTKARASKRGHRDPAPKSGGNPDNLAESERLLLARKIRGARSVLDWSQTELANRVGLTQASIHRIEQGKVELKHSTFVALERLFAAEGVTFETAESCFKIVVDLSE